MSDKRWRVVSAPVVVFDSNTFEQSDEPLYEVRSMDSKVQRNFKERVVKTSLTKEQAEALCKLLNKGE